MFFKKKERIGLQVGTCNDNSGLLVAKVFEQDTDNREWNSSIKNSFPMDCVQVGDVILSANSIRPLVNKLIDARPNYAAMIEELNTATHIVMILRRSHQK